MTCGTWIGFDDRQSLGEKETGARAALPMWMDFMRAVIVNKPNEAFAAAGEPKKVLEVPLSTGGAGVAEPQRSSKLEGGEADLGADGERQNGGMPPAAPAPNSPVGRTPATTLPSAPVGISAPAKPAEAKQPDVSHAQPDKD